MNTTVDREGEPITQSGSAGPPFQGNLTVVWETEKQDILGRLARLEEKVYAIEEWARERAARAPGAR